MYIFGVPKVVEEEKKEEDPNVWFKGEQEEQDEEVFGQMASWPAVATAWSWWGRGWGKGANFQWVKTNPGVCILRVTHPNGECSQN